VTQGRSCILIELVDATWCGFDFGDEASAASWFAECRSEWNVGRNVIIYVRNRRGGPIAQTFDADEVAHLELASHTDARSRGVACAYAMTFG
jgi:hypothetical protein